MFLIWFFTTPKPAKGVEAPAKAGERNGRAIEPAIQRGGTLTGSIRPDDRQDAIRLLTEASLVKIGGKGVFTKEIEEALLDRRVDLAVHSLKDLPTTLPEGLHLSAVTEREDVRDALVRVLFLFTGQSQVQKRIGDVTLQTVDLGKGLLEATADLATVTSFDLIYVMTNGGPGHATEILVTYIYKLGFSQTRFDYAAAVTVVFFVLLVAIAWMANRLSGGNAGAVETD